MNKYKIQAQTKAFELVVTYENNTFKAIEVDGILSADINFTIKANEQDFAIYCERVFKGRYTVEKAVPTFDHFWNSYYPKGEKKVGVSKYKTKKTFEKLSDIEKVKALAYLSIYFKAIKGTFQSKKHSTTYLNEKIWED